jgi:hypothetical protein
MASRQTISNSVTSDSIPFAARTWRVASGLLLLSSVVLSGCQQMPGGQAMRQYQLESERLLSEFRAQKKRAEELEVRNAQLEQRLAESEKLLASNPSGYSGKSSKFRNETELLIGEATGARRNNSQLSESGSSRSTGLRGAVGRTGLPDVSPSTSRQVTSGQVTSGQVTSGQVTSGQVTSGSNQDPISLGGASRDLRGDRSRESQWRPIAGSLR